MDEFIEIIPPPPKKYSIFNTEAEAIAYAAHEAEEHLPLGDNVTKFLSLPIQLTDNRWVVECIDGNGVEWSEDWSVFVQIEEP